MNRIATLLSVIALVATSGTLLAQRPQSDEEKEKARVRIGMSKEQQAQIEAMWAETDRQMKEVFTKTNDLRKQLDDLYDSYDFDRNLAAHLRREIVMLHKKRGQIFFENQEKLRKILTRDQFDRMTALVKEQREIWKKQWEKRRQEFENRRGDGPHPRPPF